VPLTEPVIHGEEVDAVASVVRGRWLTVSEQTAAFERECADILGVPEAILVTSGTAALHLAFLALGIGPGDEVIIPSLSFVAAASVVDLLGARPVFAEITSLRYPLLDLSDVRQRITPRTKAIVVMHYGGHPADVDGFRQLCAEAGLWLVEDAAHALFVESSGGYLGTLSDIGCFSFHASKNLTTGEGGLVVTRDGALARKVRQLRSHGMSPVADAGEPSYDVRCPGLNYRPTEMQAAMGRAQLARRHEDRRRRRAVVEKYLKSMDGCGVLIPFAEDWARGGLHLFVVVLDEQVDRGSFRRWLSARGVQTSVHYPPSHSFSYYRSRYCYREGDLPITENFGQRAVTLPLYAEISDGQVEQVIAAVRTALESNECMREAGKS
jgi:dTDP-4-amino-4,6-dideoxygalactose transaminase